MQPVLENRSKRIFTSQTIPNSNVKIQYNVGDIMYYETPTTHIGSICITAGTGETSVWKKFGAIET